MSLSFNYDQDLPPLPLSHNNQYFLPPLPPSPQDLSDEDSFSSASDNPSTFVNGELLDFPSFEASSGDDSFSSSSETPFNWPFQDISDEIRTSLAALQIPHSPPPNHTKYHLSSSQRSLSPEPKAPPTDEIPAPPPNSLSSLSDEGFDGKVPSPPVTESQALSEALTPSRILSTSPAPVAVSPPVTTKDSEFQTLPEAATPADSASVDMSPKFQTPPEAAEPSEPASVSVSPDLQALSNSVIPSQILSPDTASVAVSPEYQTLPNAVTPSHTLSPETAVSPEFQAHSQAVTPSRILSPDPVSVAVSPPMTANHSEFHTLPEAVTTFHILSPDPAPVAVSAPMTANHSEVQTLPEAVTPSHILSPEPDTVAMPYSATSYPLHREVQDAGLSTLQPQPVYADASADANGAPDDSQYNNSNHSPIQHDPTPPTSETSEQGEFDRASARVPYSDSERVADWSGSSSDRSIMSDTSSIFLSHHLPTPDSNGSSTSLSDSYRSLTPPKAGYLSGNQTPCPPRHTSRMSGEKQPSFNDPQQGPSPAPSLSGSRQKTYSLSSNVSYASTSSLPQNSLPQTQPPLSGQLPLSHTHLKPGSNASLLSYKKTLEMYRMQAKKMSGDLEIQFDFAVFLVGIGGGGGKLSSDEEGGNGNGEEELVDEGCRILKRLSVQGHAASQYYLATCYINGVGNQKQDWSKAFPLLQKASKHNHPDAAYLVARCYASGKGVKRDGSRALQYYKKSAAAAHPGAMYALGMAFLTGNLAIPDSDSQNTPAPLPIRKAPRDGVKWLKRACDSATPDFADALFELAKLHELGIDNVIFVDLPYAVALYTRAAELGHVRSMYRLGECYEFGKLGCELDPRRSIGWYQAAAESGHPDSCFAMTAWYLSGHPGLIPQNGTEAFHWAFKAAELGHPKATYATAYFFETGMGVEKDLESAMKWYRIAADLGDARAIERLSNGGTSRSDPVSQSSGGMAGGEERDDRKRRKGDDCLVM